MFPFKNLLLSVNFNLFMNFIQITFTPVLFICSIVNFYLSFLYNKANYDDMLLLKVQQFVILI